MPSTNLQLLEMGIRQAEAAITEFSLRSLSLTNVDGDTQKDVLRRHDKTND